jgi:hypothetical protein
MAEGRAHDVRRGRCERRDHPGHIRREVVECEAIERA